MVAHVTPDWRLGDLGVEFAKRGITSVKIAVDYEHAMPFEVTLGRIGFGMTRVRGTTLTAAIDDALARFVHCVGAELEGDVEDN